MLHRAKRLHGKGQYITANWLVRKLFEKVDVEREHRFQSCYSVCSRKCRTGIYSLCVVTFVQEELVDFIENVIWQISYHVLFNSFIFIHLQETFDVYKVKACHLTLKWKLNVIKTFFSVEDFPFENIDRLTLEGLVKIIISWTFGSLSIFIWNENVVFIQILYVFSSTLFPKHNKETFTFQDQ